MVAGFHSRELKSYLQRYRRLLLLTAALLIPLGILEWEWILRTSGQTWLGHRETLLDTVYAAAAILGFIAYDGVVLPHSSRLNSLASAAFGVYLIHPLAMEVFARGVYHVAPSLLALPLVFVSLLFAAGLGVPLLLMALVNHTPVRITYRYAFG
jgi:surface polysaccharide O-acyltransferase-like enzyme